MASTTLDSLAALSKPAVSAPASAGAAPGLPATGAASAGGAAVSAAPATIGDFLAMLSEMIAPSASLPALGAEVAKPGRAASPKGSDNGGGDLYAQLLAFIQAGSAETADSPAKAGAKVIEGLTTDQASVLQSATDPATSAAQNTAASALLSAVEAAGPGERQIIAQFLNQAQQGGVDSNAALESVLSAAQRSGADAETLASTLSESLKALLGGSDASAASGTSHSLGSLQDFAALLGSALGAGGSSASGSAAPSINQPDPAGLQAGGLQAGATASSGSAPAARDADTATHLRSPVGSSAWTEQLGSHLTWMASNDQQSASLKLTPAHLGPLEIQITMGDDKQASVWFSAPHADTRAALGEALPRLRELFGASGLTLADAGVSREPSRQNARPLPAAVAGRANSTDPGESVAIGSIRSAALHAGILDTYA